MNFFDIFDSNMEVTEHAEWSIESMNAEIKELTKMDELYAQEEAAAIYLGTCETELTHVTMAAMESAGKSEEEAATIFAGYGLTDSYAMEAAKDVIARGAYVALTKIKTIIASIVKVITGLFSFNGNIKKAGKKIEKMAKDQKKALAKKRGSGKIAEDKFTREITNSLKEATSKVTEDFVKTLFGKLDANKYTSTTTSETKDIDEFKKTAQNVGSLLGIKDTDIKDDEDAMRTVADGIKEKLQDAVKDVFDNAMEREEFEKAQLFATIMTRLTEVETTAKTMAKEGAEAEKALEKLNKDLNKLRSESKLKALGDNAPTALKFISIVLSFVNYLQTGLRMVTKGTIKWMDNVLTDAKAVESML